MRSDRASSSASLSGGTPGLGRLCGSTSDGPMSLGAPPSFNDVAPRRGAAWVLLQVPAAAAGGLRKMAATRARSGTDLRGARCRGPGPLGDLGAGTQKGRRAERGRPCGAWERGHRLGGMRSFPQPRSRRPLVLSRPGVVGSSPGARGAIIANDGEGRRRARRENSEHEKKKPGARGGQGSRERHQRDPPFRGWFRIFARLWQQTAPGGSC